MKMNLRSYLSIALLLLPGGCVPLRAEVSWFPLGPFGGDARSFAADPRDAKHIYLGTATGWVYESHDGGTNWKRVAQIAHRNDLVIDHILSDPNDPQRLIVGAWKVDLPDGGLWISEDGGANWYAQAEMHGQSVRSLARSATNPNELIAGTLRGVYRSLDDGTHWKQISPDGSTEIHEIESIAIDPTDPNTIYAGTWHLPWKTTDGGATWRNIKEGIIEDSDVFSIIVDPAQPKVVYASACSGIYKSVDAGNLFHGGVTVNKGQGIPSTARRTRKLAQDPKHLDTVYAGTTEGLYRTIDAGAHWGRLSGPDLIVNDIYIDPTNPDHVLLATDRGGVMASENAGESFHGSSAGFSARQIVAYASDPRNPSHLYVGVVNDKETGGVFSSRDAGVSWHQQSRGLGGKDVFSLATTQDGTVLAGTSHGVFRLENDDWISAVLPRTAESFVAPVAAPLRTKPKAAVAGKAQADAAPTAPLDDLIYTLLPASTAVYAGTSDGLLRGDVDGGSWKRVASLHLDEVRFLAEQGKMLLAADLKRLEISSNGGQSWKNVPLPAELDQISAMSVDDRGTIWAGGREGLFHSKDMGATWAQITDLQLNDVDSVYFDAGAQRMLVTTAQSSFVFSVHLPDNRVKYWNSGWKLRFARPVGDHIVAATLFDGIVVQPQMVDSAVGPTALETPKPVAGANVAAATSAASSSAKP